jgi:DNA-binding PadR family transcriptional regulator
MKTTNTLTPLTPAVFYILLALASSEKHGYEIMKQVKQDSQGQVKMGTGTLYG